MCFFLRPLARLLFGFQVGFGSSASSCLCFCLFERSFRRGSLPGNFFRSPSQRFSLEPETCFFFTAETGYPADLSENGIPTRDMAWMDLDLA